VRQGSPRELSDAGSDHRRRLTAAMVETASEHGFLGATVARVVERAGVSRATFYEHFADRADCFRAAHRERAEAMTARVDASRAGAPAGGAEAVVDALIASLAEDRPGARFLLVGALGSPPSVRREHEELIRRVERSVACFLDEQPPERAIQIPAAALVAGVADVLARQALANGTADLAAARLAVSRWIDAYRLPPGVRPLSQDRWRELGRFAREAPATEPAEPQLLPRGRTALPDGAAARARRRRILDATARLCRERGYCAVTVAEIAAAARVPRSAFYAHFSDKKEALMAAQTAGLQSAMAVAAAEYSPVAPWAERVWKLIRGFLGYLAEAPDYAHLDFVESYAAGSEAVRHRQQNHAVFALFLEDGYRRQGAEVRLPWACTEAIAGAVLGLIRKTIVEGRTERMLSLMPAAGYTVLAPFTGPQEAARKAFSWGRAAR